MPISIYIDTRGNPQGYVKAIRSLAFSPEAAQAVGQSAAEAWRENLRRKDRTGNRLRGERTHYWAKAAASVKAKVKSNRVQLTASQVGLLQHYKGGPITAKKARMLTIPVNPKAHAKSAGEIGGLSVIKTGKGSGARLLLAKTDNGSPRLEAYYLLTKSVMQEPDPTVVNEQEILEAGRRGLSEFLNTRRSLAGATLN